MKPTSIFFIAISTSVFVGGWGGGLSIYWTNPVLTESCGLTSVYTHLHKTCCVLCVLSLMDVLVQCVVCTVVDPFSPRLSVHLPAFFGDDK